MLTKLSLSRLPRNQLGRFQHALYDDRCLRSCDAYCRIQSIRSTLRQTAPYHNGYRLLPPRCMTE